MTDTNSANADDPNRIDDDRRRKMGELTAIVVERDGLPDECTVYPRGASDETLVTEWITAEEGSYVALEAMR